MATLQQRVTAFINAIGPDIKALYSRVPPSGGTSGQLLSKNSATNYDYAWINPPSSGGNTTLTASGTAGAVTVACGSNPSCFCAITTTGNITVNVSSSGLSWLVLRITLGGAHTVTIQYGSTPATANVKYLAGVTPNTANGVNNTVYFYSAFLDASIMEVMVYHSR